MDGHSVISTDVVARYARDATLEVPGVTRVVEGARKGVRVEPESIELHLAVAWGVSIPELSHRNAPVVSIHSPRAAEPEPVAEAAAAVPAEGAAAAAAAPAADAKKGDAKADAAPAKKEGGKK